MAAAAAASPKMSFAATAEHDSSLSNITDNSEMLLCYRTPDDATILIGLLTTVIDGILTVVMS